MNMKHSVETLGNIEVVEHHGVAVVDGVGPTQLLNPRPDTVRGLVVELEDGKTYESTNAVGIKSKSPIESKASFLSVAKLEETVAHS